MLKAKMDESVIKLGSSYALHTMFKRLLCMLSALWCFFFSLFKAPLFVAIVP